MRLTSIAALAMKNDIVDLLPKHCTKREQYPLCRYVLMSLDFFPPNHFIDYTYKGQRDRFRWPATNVNILGTSHIPHHQCRSPIHRHQEEAHIPCCHNGRYRLSPFELWSMERL